MSAGAIGEWREWPVLVDLGSTPLDRGYDVNVAVVQMPRGDTRVRIALRKDGVILKHIDLKGSHAMHPVACQAQRRVPRQGGHMLVVYLMLVAVGYVVGRVHGDAIRWARGATRPTLQLPRAEARRTRAARHARWQIHGVDPRDFATWPRPRLPGGPP